MKLKLQNVIIVIVFGERAPNTTRKLYINAFMMSILPNKKEEIQFMTLNVKIVKMRMKIVLSDQIWISNSASGTRLCLHSSTMFSKIMVR